MSAFITTSLSPVARFYSGESSYRRPLLAHEGPVSTLWFVVCVCSREHFSDATVFCEQVAKSNCTIYRLCKITSLANALRTTRIVRFTKRSRIRVTYLLSRDLHCVWKKWTPK